MPLKDGRILDRHSAPLRAADGTWLGRVWYFRDVTGDKRAEAVERERNALRDAVTAMEQVLGVVGHELRTPLAAVRGMAECLLMSTPSLPADQTDFLRHINEQVVRMADLVHDLLEAARLNSGRARWNWSSFAPASACADAMEGIRPLVNVESVRLIVDLDPRLEVMRGDEGAVRRLLVNLLSNSQKHTQRGEIRVTLKAYQDAVGEWVEVRVADTGCGIRPEVLARLGDPFVLNSGMVGDAHVRGTGLGVSICKGIAAAHGGRVEFASEPGSGTTVTVWLRRDLPGPVSDVAAAARAGREDAQRAA